MKLQIKLDREYLERIYLTLILPILESSCAIYFFNIGHSMRNPKISKSD